MEKEEFLELIKDMIAAYESKKESSPEIRMWRERFLSSLPKYDDVEKAAFVWTSFLYIPSNDMTKKPEHYVKWLENQYESKSSRSP